MEYIEKGFTYLFDNYSPFVVVTCGTFVLHELFYFGSYLPYFIADQIPYFQRWKLQPEKKNVFPLQWNCFKWVMIMHIFTQIPLMALSHNLLSWAGMTHEPPFPTLPSILGQIVFFYMVEDFWFYWTHRLFHWGPFYKHIHKIHHEHTAPFGITGEYAHPLESLVLGIGTGLGAFIVRAHLLTLWIWLFFRVWQVIDCHSGYDFPWSPTRYIPFWGGAEFHDYHHMAFKGNYASTFIVWDWVFGTDKGYRVLRAKEKKEKQLKAQ